MAKQRASRNQTLSCSAAEIKRLSKRLLRLDGLASIASIEDRIVNQDLFAIAHLLPREFADLIILDPPYNLSKDFHGHLFRSREKLEYRAYFESVLNALLPLLKPHGTVYACSDWKTSVLIAPILEERLIVRNRITWEREKGRGSKTNWKNNTEDIWFCTRSEDYFLNVDAVKLKRKVVAPYRDSDGKPKDWDEGKNGNYRLTHPSNIWTDLTIPFWSMPENTDHPTQKPEKLIAKLVLASTEKGGMVFDPFLGSGTTAVVSKKLGRRFVGVEQNTDYCCWGQKRLAAANAEPSIQGYSDGVFWDRNSRVDRKTGSIKPTNSLATIAPAPSAHQ